MATQEEIWHQEAADLLKEGEKLFGGGKIDEAREKATQAMQRMRGMEQSTKDRIRTLWTRTTQQVPQMILPKSPSQATESVAAVIPAAAQIMPMPPKIPEVRKPKKKEKQKEQEETRDPQMLLQFMRTRFTEFPNHPQLGQWLIDICSSEKKRQLDTLYLLLQQMTREALPGPFVTEAFNFIVANKIIRLKDMQRNEPVRSQLQMNDLLKTEVEDEK